MLPVKFREFARQSPTTVMLRGILEYACSDEFIDEVFRRNAVLQYEDELLFSTVVNTLGLAVCGGRKSVNAAYKTCRERFSVSVISLYNKIKNVELQVSQALVRETSRVLLPVAANLYGDKKGPLPGYRLKILDGKHLEGTQRRIRESRWLNERPRPGFAIVVLDPQLMLVTDVYPCEDAYDQERSLFGDILPNIEHKDVIVGDRLYCTTEFLIGIDRRRANYVIRQHASTLQNKELLGRRRKIGPCKTGIVYEQKLQIRDSKTGETLIMRRITVQLNRPTRDGDNEIHILTNLPKRIDAITIAELYHGRWTIENAFQEISQAFKSEIDTLCYPKAALLCLCVALYTYNVLSVMKMAIERAHCGAIERNSISGYYLAEETAAIYGGMMIAVPPAEWRRAFKSRTPKQLVKVLLWLAAQVNIDRFRKNVRGPKKPKPKRTGDYRRHVSTARLLAQRKQGSGKVIA